MSDETELLANRIASSILVGLTGVSATVAAGFSEPLAFAAAVGTGAYALHFQRTHATDRGVDVELAERVDAIERNVTATDGGEDQ